MKKLLVVFFLLISLQVIPTVARAVTDCSIDGVPIDCATADFTPTRPYAVFSATYILYIPEFDGNWGFGSPPFSLIIEGYDFNLSFGQPLFELEESFSIHGTLLALGPPLPGNSFNPIARLDFFGSTRTYCWTSDLNINCTGPPLGGVGNYCVLEVDRGCTLPVPEPEPITLIFLGGLLAGLAIRSWQGVQITRFLTAPI